MSGCSRFVSLSHFSSLKLWSLLAVLVVLHATAALAEDPTPGVANRITGGQNIPASNFPPPLGSPPVLNPTVGEMGLNSLGSFDLGVGTLIGPQQVLFSAQTITDPNTGQIVNTNLGTDLRFRLNGTIYTGRAVAIHPTWFGALNPPIPTNEGHYDLAILILSQQVPSTIPTPVYPNLGPVNLLIGGYGYLSSPINCGNAIIGLKPGSGTIQAAFTSQVIPPSPTPTFLICAGGPIGFAFPPGNVSTLLSIPTSAPPPFPFYGDVGAPALVLDPPTIPPNPPPANQAWKICAMATYNTPLFSCGRLAYYVRLDTPPAQQFINQFVSTTPPGFAAPVGPDIALTAVTQPGNPIAGVPYTFQVTLVNQGLVAAGPFFLAGYHDSTTAVLSSFGADTGVQINGLAPGASITVSLTITWPKSGKFTLKVQADPDHAVPETDTFNNTFTFNEKVLSPNLDITIPFVIKQTTAGVDTGFTLVLENDGLQTAGPFTLDAFSNLLDSPDKALNQDPSIPLPTPDLGQITVPGIPANSQVSVAVNLPNGATRSGRAWFWANPPKAIGNPLPPLAEDDTTNNIASGTWGVQAGTIQIASPLTSGTNSGGIGQVGSVVQFSVAGSATDATGASTPLTYKWDFGDGTTAITNSPTVSHTYSAPGTYPVTVQISSGPFSTATSTLSFQATVNPTLVIGPVSASAKHGNFHVTLPRPPGFGQHDRLTSKLISTDTGLNIRYSNGHVSAKLTSASVGSKNFTVLYLAHKTGKSVQVTYTLVVTP